MPESNTCSHLQDLDLESLKTKADYPRFECAECVKMNSKWVHLRICQECGLMLCCDSSPNQHARRHFEATSHPIISSAELGENWVYCFVDVLTNVL